MAVKYILREKMNPVKPNEPRKFYAIAKSTGEITLRNISKEISTSSSTVSDTDVLAVLNDLTKLLARHLSEGRIVRFGDFGSFQITVSSEGTEDQTKFKPTNIKGAKINFRPGLDLKEMLTTLKFEKYK